MKKIGKILFAFMFMVVGLFGMGNASAASYEIIYNNNYYDYYMTGGNDKLSMNIVSGNNNEIIKKAIDYFYQNASSNRIHVIPFEFKVKDGMTWDATTDSATMYINIPKVFNLTESDSIYLVRVSVDSNSNVTTLSYSLTEDERMYKLKNYSDIESIIKSDSVVSYGSVSATDYFSNQFAVLETSNFDKTGTTYYMLITCKGEEPTTTTTTTTIKPTEPTTTTTIENPKTADVSGQLYVVIGAIALIGIVGLGAKFVKANK